MRAPGLCSAGPWILNEPGLETPASGVRRHAGSGRGEEVQAELADALAAEYGVSREISEKDTADFLSVIRSAGFIEE